MIRLVIWLALSFAIAQIRQRTVPAATLRRYAMIRQPGDARVMRGIAIAMFFVSVLLPTQSNWLLTLAGYNLMISGQSLLGWAMQANPYYSPAITAPPVIAAGGPYRYFRHPAYLGHAASILGVWLVWQSVYALPFLLAFWGLLVWRSRRESILLAG